MSELIDQVITPPSCSESKVTFRNALQHNINNIFSYSNTSDELHRVAYLLLPFQLHIPNQEYHKAHDHYIEDLSLEYIPTQSKFKQSVYLIPS